MRILSSKNITKYGSADTRKTHLKKSLASVCIEIKICTDMLSREVHQCRFLLLLHKMEK